MRKKDAEVARDICAVLSVKRAVHSFTKIKSESRGFKLGFIMAAYEV